MKLISARVPAVRNYHQHLRWCVQNVHSVAHKLPTGPQLRSLKRFWSAEYVLLSLQFCTLPIESLQCILSTDI